MKWKIYDQWNFNSVKWAFIEAKSEALEIHYGNTGIKSYCFRSIQPTLFSFTAWIRINVFCVARAYWALLLIHRGWNRPLRDMSSAYRQHHYHDNGVHIEFLTRHECTDITYAMHRLHLISPCEVLDRSIFFLPWRVDRSRKEKHARCVTRRGSIASRRFWTTVNFSFTPENIGLSCPAKWNLFGLLATRRNIIFAELLSIASMLFMQI